MAHLASRVALSWRTRRPHGLQATSLKFLQRRSLRGKRCCHVVVQAGNGPLVRFAFDLDAGHTNLLLAAAMVEDARRVALGTLLLLRGLLLHWLSHHSAGESNTRGDIDTWASAGAG